MVLKLQLESNIEELEPLIKTAEEQVEALKATLNKINDFKLKASTTLIND